MLGKCISQWKINLSSSHLKQPYTSGLFFVFLFPISNIQLCSSGKITILLSFQFIWLAMFLALTEDRFTKLLTTAWTHLIFKHSPTCGVSSVAHAQITAWMSTYHEPIYLLDVQQAPELKFHVAETLGIRHESPQLLLLKNGLIEAVANHRFITTQLLASWFTL